MRVKADTYMLGPVPAVKFRSSPPRGQGVTPDSVFPSPGISSQVRPSTDVLRAACAASMDTVPSPSTNPRWRSRVNVRYQHTTILPDKGECVPWNPFGATV